MIPDCDQAVVGLTQDHRPVYDYDRLVECFMKNNDWTVEMAVGMGRLQRPELSRDVRIPDSYDPIRGRLMENVEEKEFKSFFKDVYGHWLYWKDHLNANPDDCCNLRVFRKQ